MMLKKRSLRDELKYLLDSTVDLPGDTTGGYDKDTLLMRLEACVRTRCDAEREALYEHFTEVAIDAVKRAASLRRALEPSP
jgi:hypothetical protein